MRDLEKGEMSVGPGFVLRFGTMSREVGSRAVRSSLGQTARDRTEAEKSSTIRGLRLKISAPRLSGLRFRLEMRHAGT